jgi:hypothetical protein
MTTISRHRRGLVAALTAVALGVGMPVTAAAAGSNDDDDGDEIVVTLLDEGDPSHRVVLVPALTAGMAADSTSTYDIDMAMTGHGYPIDLSFAATAELARTTEVLSVASDGAYTSRETIDSFAMTMTDGAGDPTDAGELGIEGGTTSDFTPLVDVPLVATYSAAGDLTGLSPEGATALSAEQLELVDEFADAGFFVGGFAALMPRTAVGEGAVWTLTEPASPAALGLPVALRFTLVSLKGTSYRVQLTLEGDASDLFQVDDPATEVTGDMTLTGVVSGEASRPFDQCWSLSMTVDMTSTEDGVSIDVDSAIDFEQVSTPR